MKTHHYLMIANRALYDAHRAAREERPDLWRDILALCHKSDFLVDEAASLVTPQHREGEAAA